MCAARGSSHHAGSVQVLGLLRLPVQGQEGVGVARRAVTQAVALLQQAVVPHHLAALQGVAQVLGHAEALGAKHYSLLFIFIHCHRQRQRSRKMVMIFIKLDNALIIIKKKEKKKGWQPLHSLTQ